MYWWTLEIAELRKNCIKARRLATRSKTDESLRREYKIRQKQLKREIKNRKSKCWKELLDEVEDDPWGMAYKIVNKKLRVNTKVPGLEDPKWVKEIIRDLFPTRDPWTRRKPYDYEFSENDVFTRDELQVEARKLKCKKATGPDGIPNEIIKIVAKEYPECLLEAFNSCLRHGVFFKNWKKQKLILLRKGNKPLDKASSYRPLCLLDTMGKLMEGLILQRLEKHISTGKNFSDRQFGFRKGRSTTDAIREVVRIAETAKNGTGKKGVLCSSSH